MTDLVILHGVKWLLKTHAFPFNVYVVEYGNEDRNDHDITAVNKGKKFTCEAFNVAPSFFQTKKSSMLKKLRKVENKSDYKVIMANADSVRDVYSPKVRIGEYYIFVAIVVMYPATVVNSRVLAERTVGHTWAAFAIFHPTTALSRVLAESAVGHRWTAVAVIHAAAIILGIAACDGEALQDCAGVLSTDTLYNRSDPTPVDCGRCSPVAAVEPDSPTIEIDGLGVCSRGDLNLVYAGNRCVDCLLDGAIDAWDIEDFSCGDRAQRCQ